MFWLTRELDEGQGDFQMQVRLGRLDSSRPLTPGWVGFRFGMKGHFADYRDTAVRGLGVDAGITHEGELFIGKPKQGPRVAFFDSLRLEARGSRVTLEAGGQSVSEEVPAQWISGGVALVCHAGDPPRGVPQIREPNAPNSGKPDQQRGGNIRWWFEDWSLSGSKVIDRPERAWGPILFVLYTNSGGLLKITVQLAPMEGDEPPCELYLAGKLAGKEAVEPFSSTASFRVPRWRAGGAVPFEVRFQGQRYTGVIRSDPVRKPQLVVGALTCQGDFGFPHKEIARNLKALDPDILFFTGDQLYEANGGYGIERAPVERARLDYLRKWYMFGWAWGELTRERPCVCLPDDHDVYHGNLWGAGGRKAEYPSPGRAEETAPARQLAQDSGGYTMPAQWVNLVEQTQSSHLPDPPNAQPAEQGIRVHYCELIWGGVSFAVLEDRKWKSAPRQILPDARIRNGWPQNPVWNAARQSDVAGAQLLGERQERFLEDWAERWPPGVEMKAVVSATIFCNLATLPKGHTSDAGTPKLPVLPVGDYAEQEKLTQDHDSNGWPQTPRNRALRLMRKCLAVHIAGDQHLASTVQYGIEDWNDGPFAICTPAISNIFPRRWFPPQPGRNARPGAPRNSGEYLDGFGNHMTVHAVANPHRYGVPPQALNDRAPGFGLVVLNKVRREIRLENWPRWADVTRPDAKPFPGWPIIIRQLDNGLNGARYELHLPQAISGLIRVHRKGEGKPVLAFRSREGMRRLPIWHPGAYEVRSGARRWLIEAQERG